MYGLVRGLGKTYSTSKTCLSTSEIPEKQQCNYNKLHASTNETELISLGQNNNSVSLESCIICSNSEYSVLLRLFLANFVLLQK